MVLCFVSRFLPIWQWFEMTVCGDCIRVLWCRDRRFPVPCVLMLLHALYVVSVVVIPDFWRPLLSTSPPTGSCPRSGCCARTNCARGFATCWSPTTSSAGTCRIRNYWASCLLSSRPQVLRLHLRAARISRSLGLILTYLLQISLMVGFNLRNCARWFNVLQIGKRCHAIWRAYVGWFGMLQIYFKRLAGNLKCCREIGFKWHIDWC